MPISELIAVARKTASPLMTKQMRFCERLEGGMRTFLHRREGGIPASGTRDAGQTNTTATTGMHHYVQKILPLESGRPEQPSDVTHLSRAVRRLCSLQFLKNPTSAVHISVCLRGYAQLIPNSEIRLCVTVLGLFFSSWSYYSPRF